MARGGGWGAPGCFPKSIRFFSFTPVLEIALRTTGDRSFLIVDLQSAIFDLLGDISRIDDLDSISISISILGKKNGQF